MQIQNMYTELKHTMIQTATENEYTQATPNNITLRRKSKQINQM